MRNILFLISVIGISCATWAEGSQSSWTNLGALQVGAPVQIVTMNSENHSGTFVNASETAIVYRDSAGEKNVQKQDVRSVRLMESRHRLRNAFIAAGVGAGAGAGIGVASWENRGFAGGKGVGAAVGAAIGFAGGAIVGALIPSHQMIYRAPSH